MDHICFHGVVSSNEAVSRLLANSILLCDIKDYHSMRAEKKKNHSETAQREELLGTERTINSNLYLMSKRTEHEQKKRAKANRSLISQWGSSAPMPIYGEWYHYGEVREIWHFCSTGAICHSWQEAHTLVACLNPDYSILWNMESK